MPARKPRLRRQTPVKGGRYYHSAGFIEQVEAAIEKERARVLRTHGWLVGRSFVIANAVAFALLPDLDIESYEDEPGKTRKARKYRDHR